MDYKKKLRSRLNVAITYIVLGVMFIVGTFITKTENDFISTFGFMMILMGLVRIRNYRIITKDEDTKLRNKRAAYREQTKTKKAIHLTMITPNGVKRNSYWNDIQSEVTLNDLFQ